MRKLENFFRFSSGPVMDRFLRMGLTISVAFGTGKDAGKELESKRRRIFRKYIRLILDLKDADDPSSWDSVLRRSQL